MKSETFDNSHKETPEALEWFRDNLYIKDDVLYWGESTKGRKRSSHLLDKQAGTKSSRGYIQVRKGKDKFMAHRIMWGIHNGCWPDGGIDHINGIKDDNRIENLREADQFKNSKNASKYPRSEPWIPTGVTRHGKRWVASAQVNLKKKHIGVFGCPTAAWFARIKFNAENEFSERHGTSMNEAYQ